MPNISGILGAMVLVAAFVACSPSDKELEQAKAAEERRSIEHLITDDSSFSVCQMYKLQVGHHVIYDHHGGPRNFPESPVEQEQDYYASFNSRPITLLRELGYITLYTLQGPQAFWTPTSKGRSAIGTTIEQIRTQDADLEVEQLNLNYIRMPTKANSCSMEEVKSVGYWTVTCFEQFTWKVILGCRQFAQIDGITPLADGKRIDFSWGWHTTDIGDADGLVRSRQRGEAYLLNSNGSWAVDKIYFKE